MIVFTRKTQRIRTYTYFLRKKKQLGEKRVPYIAVESDKLLHKYIVLKKKAG